MAASKRRGGGPVEEAMQDQRVEILKAVEKEFDAPQWVLISFFDAEATVDIRDKDGEYLRFRWRPDENKVAEERALAGLKIRRVWWGKRPNADAD